MRDRSLLRGGPWPVAAAAALTFQIAAGTAVAGPGISASTSGSTVTVSTSSCTPVNGAWGTASLLSAGETGFAEGRRAALAGTTAGQSAVWRDVRPGTYTVIVVCADDMTAGTQSVVVSAPSKPATSSAPAASTPSRGLLDRPSSRVEADGTMVLAMGGALVGAAMIATGWVLRRRSKPYPL
ncbi:hypothetical protein [Streptomyces sp. MK7]|uniref:hypothetical protein n=1 Tax=Streptomyces sp. MK7 TaxID=3067635 RepID=UPI00292CE539|nr:hypothetical protein [Streptomyces sp. MK7]